MMNRKTLFFSIIVLLFIGVVIFFNSQPKNIVENREDIQKTNKFKNEVNTDDEEISNEKQDESSNTNDLTFIDRMSLEERRVYYEKISRNKPYVSIAEVLNILDRGLIDNDIKVRIWAINRFIKSRYKYGRREPSSLFNNDPHRKKIFIELLNEEDRSIRSGVFRVLSEGYFQQEDIARILVGVIAQENTRERLFMVRSFANFMWSYPDIAKPFYIDEVRTGSIDEYRHATPGGAAFILSRYPDPPLEIIEPVIEMLETDRTFGSPMLLDTLRNYGDFVKPYLDRLKQLQERVNSEIVNKRYTYKQSERETGTYSTFSKQAYNEFIEALEQQ